MASILDTLSKAGRAAYPVIQKGVTDGLSANAIGRALEAGGLGIRRSTLLDIVAQERHIQGLGQTLKFLDPSRIINPARLPEAATKIRRAFSYTAVVKGTLTDSGVSFEKHVQVTSSSPMSPAQIISEAMAAAEEAGERYGMEVESAIVVRAVKAGAAGSFS